MKFLYIIFTLFFFYGCSDESAIKKDTVQNFEVSLSPSLGGGYVPAVDVDAQIVVYPTVELNMSTVNTNSVFIRETGSGDRPIQEVKAFHTPTNEALLITPLLHLIEYTDYEIVVTTDVATLSGAHRSEDAIISFTTSAEEDNEAPSLVSTLPENGSLSESEPYTSICFQFSEPISPLDVSSLDVNVTPQTGTEPPIGGEIVISGSLLTFVPDRNLTDGSSYIAKLDTTHIFDLAGNAYADGSFIDIAFDVNTVANVLPFFGGADLNIGVQANVMKSVGSSIIMGTENGIEVLGYDNNATGNKLSRLASFSSPQLGAVYSLKIDMALNVLYVSSATGFSIIDISSSTMSILSHIDILNEFGHYLPIYGLDTVSGHAYLADPWIGITDINISDTLSPAIIAQEYTNGIAFDVVADTESLLISSQYVGVSVMNRFTLEEGAPLPSDTTFSRSAFVDSDYGIFYAAGTSGIGRYSSENYSVKTAAYITRYIERRGWSCGIAKDLGLIFMDLGDYIIGYQILPYEVKMIGYVDEKTPDDEDVLIISDPQGQLYVELMPPY